MAYTISKILNCAMLSAFVGGVAVSFSGNAAAEPSIYATKATAVKLKTGAEGPRFFSINAVMAQRGVFPVKSRVNDGAKVQDVALRGSLTEDTATTTGEFPFEDRGFALFGSVNDSIAKKWEVVLAKWEAEKKTVDECMKARDGACKTSSANIFASIARQIAAKNGEDKLAALNALVNGRVTYMSDMAHYGKDDVWASPLETLGGRGDCEDYAIAKYFLLAYSGANVDDMSIVLLREKGAKEDHAALAVKEGGTWRLLDNRWDRVEFVSEKIEDRPIFNVRMNGIEMFAAPFLPKTTALKIKEASTAPASAQPVAVN